MRFELDDDHFAFRDAVAGLLSRYPGAARAAWEEGPADRRLWDDLVAMGVVATLVPETDGGVGLDEIFLAVVLEETGRWALPHPIVESAVAAPLVAGTSLVSSDLGGPNIAWAADAELLLLRADDGLHVVDPAVVDIAPTLGVDRSRRLGRVTWRPTPTTLVTGDSDTIGLAQHRGALGTAAQLVGLAQRMLDMTASYVKARQQFGVPIGSFQAVKHHLADALEELAFARPVVYRAAWSIANRADSMARDVSMAKAMASHAATVVGRIALQCHGAIGYTVEYDLHLFLKRAWALAGAWGDAASHRDRVGTALGI